MTGNLFMWVMNYLYNKECAILESQQCSKAVLGKIPSEVLFCSCQLDDLSSSWVQWNRKVPSLMVHSLLIETGRCEVIYCSPNCIYRMLSEPKISNVHFILSTGCLKRAQCCVQQALHGLLNYSCFCSKWRQWPKIIDIYLRSLEIKFTKMGGSFLFFFPK